MNKNKFKSISNFISRKGLHTIRVKLSTIQWLSGQLNDDSHGNLLKKTNTSTPLEQKKYSVARFRTTSLCKELKSHKISTYWHQVQLWLRRANKTICKQFLKIENKHVQC
jgi:hypothetical protein